MGQIKFKKEIQCIKDLEIYIFLNFVVQKKQ